MNKNIIILIALAITAVSCFEAGQLIDTETRAEIQGLSQYLSTRKVDFYTKYDQIFDYCGAEGYLEKFIIPYGTAYLNAREEFINKEWQDGVRYCLQKALFDNSKDVTHFPTCKEISDWGFGSHVGCYLKPVPERPEITWCKLPIADQVKIAWIARGAFWEALKQGFPILFKCITGQENGFLA